MFFFSGFCVSLLDGILFVMYTSNPFMPRSLSLSLVKEENKEKKSIACVVD